jgi:hypothetical protein
VIHVTITHQVTGRASSLQFTLQYRHISFSAPGSPAGSAEQASPEHVCSGYCLTAYCHTHLSHRSDGCSCSRRLLRFPSDIYCSCVIFSYVSFCINTIASSELSPQTQSPRHQSSRPPSLLIALLIPETALLIVTHGVHISSRHLHHPCPTSSLSEGSFRLPLYLVAQSLYRAVTVANQSITTGKPDHLRLVVQPGLPGARCRQVHYPQAVDGRGLGLACWKTHQTVSHHKVHQEHPQSIQHGPNLSGSARRRACPRYVVLCPVWVRIPREWQAGRACK